MNWSKIFILIFVIVAIVSHPIDCACPHPNFISKHVNTMQQSSKENAQSFAQQVEIFRKSIGGRFTHKNTVFFGNGRPINYGIKSGDDEICSFTEPLTAYVCMYSNNQWNCEKNSQKLCAQHSTSNGHYMYHITSYKCPNLK